MSVEGYPEVEPSNFNTAVTSTVIYSKNSLWKKASPPSTQIKNISLSPP